MIENEITGKEHLLLKGNEESSRCRWNSNAPSSIECIWLAGNMFLIVLLMKILYNSIGIIKRQQLIYFHLLDLEELLG